MVVRHAKRGPGERCLIGVLLVQDDLPAARQSPCHVGGRPWPAPVGGGIRDAVANLRTLRAWGRSAPRLCPARSAGWQEAALRRCGVGPGRCVWAVPRRSVRSSPIGCYPPDLAQAARSSLAPTLDTPGVALRPLDVRPVELWPRCPQWHGCWWKIGAKFQPRMRALRYVYTQARQERFGT